MKSLKKIRVLIIDDSLVFREALTRGLSEDSGIEVAGTASDAITAFALIEELKPDVITVDIEMPGMNGIDFIKKLLPIYTIPVIVVSSVDARVFEAISVGAIDFVLKPGINNLGIKGFFSELSVKLKVASIAKTLYHTNQHKVPTHIPEKSSCKKIIAIGASTGGTEAILQVLRDMPVNMPGIVIVQHIPPVFSKMFADRLNNMCQLKVKEARDGDELLNGCVLISPGEFHMKVVKRDGKLFAKCFDGEKVGGHRPSVDVLFDSVAQTVGHEAVGVILTGMGRDGAKGLLNMKNKGAFTIGQDEESSVVYGMPMEALRLGAISKQIPLNRIGEFIVKNFSY